MLVRVATVAAFALLTAACGSDGDGTDTSAGAQRNVASDSAPLAEEEPTDDAPWLSVAESSLGSILVDTEGFALYVLVSADGDPEACTETCAEIWPPAPAATGRTLGADVDPSLVGQVDRADGVSQVVYGGHPLYRYRDDAAPGDVNGQGVNDVWFVIDPSGEVVGAPVAESPVVDAPSTDGGDPFSY